MIRHNPRKTRFYAVGVESGTETSNTVLWRPVFLFCEKGLSCMITEADSLSQASDSHAHSRPADTPGRTSTNDRLPTSPGNGELEEAGANERSTAHPPQQSPSNPEVVEETRYIIYMDAQNLGHLW